MPNFLNLSLYNLYIFYRTPCRIILRAADGLVRSDSRIISLSFCKAADHFGDRAVRCDRYGRIAAGKRAARAVMDLVPCAAGILAPLDRYLARSRIGKRRDGRPRHEIRYLRR